MSKRKSSLHFAISMALAAVLTLSAGAAQADSAGEKLEGAWIGTVTATNPPLGSFTDLISFSSEGGVIESRRLDVPDSPSGSLLETLAHGQWSRGRNGEFVVQFVFLLQGAPDNAAARGVALGTDNIRMTLERNRSGSKLSGTFQSDVKDPDGNVVFTTVGTYEATPVRVDP